MAAEHMGITALAAAVLFALLSAGLPGRIAGEVERRLCTLAGAACEARASERSPEPELTPQQQAARDLGPSEWGEPAPGTPDERIRTRTPPPPSGDQCSHSPDQLGRTYDFNYACYGHDICWQTGGIGGVTMDKFGCNRVFLSDMRRHCDLRHGSGGVRRRACRAAAFTYYEAVQAAAIAEERRLPARARLRR